MGTPIKANGVSSAGAWHVVNNGPLYDLNPQSTLLAANVSTSRVHRPKSVVGSYIRVRNTGAHSGRLRRYRYQQRAHDSAITLSVLANPGLSYPETVEWYLSRFGYIKTGPFLSNVQGYQYHCQT